MEIHFFLSIIVTIYLTTDFAVCVNPGKQSEGGCPYTSFEKSSDSISKIAFSYNDPQKELGYSVELLFDQDIFNLKVVRSDNTPANVSEVSKTHWIVSTFKSPLQSANETSFKGNYIDKSDAKLTGVILNGQHTLCGEGDSKIFSLKTMQYDGNRECILKINNYEHESNYVLEENFHSSTLGLVVDLFFASDVDDIGQVDIAVYKRINKRRYTFINYGFLTSEDKPIKIHFAVHHRNRAPPKVAAIYINDVIICGFAPVLKVTESDVVTSMIPLLTDTELKSESIKYLIWPLTIISVSGFVTSIVTGIFAWKLILLQLQKIQPTSE